MDKDHKAQASPIGSGTPGLIFIIAMINTTMSMDFGMSP